MKIDPYKHKEAYFKWKERVENGIPEISQKNSDLIKGYIFDMEKGINIASGSIKGGRSHIRLNYLKQRMIFLAKEFEARFRVDLDELTEEIVFNLFGGMRNGKIKRKDGKDYQSVADFVKSFKAFWHWHMKILKKKGMRIEDITTDLDASKTKPKWVYLTEDQIRELCNSAKYEYKVLMMFLLDTGIRSPTELINVRVSDLYVDCKEVHIREEISKTFGRRIKLMLCSELIKEYIQTKGLKDSDQLFDINSGSANKYLQRLAERVLGNGLSPAGKKYSDLTLYHFRHCACCYWLPRYKSESALKYRFGWKKSDKIHYYSELLGMRDTISEEDILIDVTKTEIEKRLGKTERENQIIREENEQMKIQMQKIMLLVKELGMRTEILN